MMYVGKKRTSVFCKLLYSIGFSALLFSCSEEQAEPPFSLRMLTKINEVRRDGCTCGSEFMPPASATGWNTALESAAIVHARDMADRNYFDHVSPEGTSPQERVYQMDYQGEFLYENIASGYSGIEEVVEAWLKSESHCNAIMDSSNQEIGVAKFKEYWVMEMGKKKD